MGSLNEAAKAKKLQRKLQAQLAQAMVAWLQSTKGAPETPNSSSSLLLSSLELSDTQVCEP